ncbi:MAG: type IV secretion system DNA-binding domain-containing protein [Candidatus Schekmanbacteria bacterium]|nr:type IV secretion system DNA-binding domain-containing protein [Candidatus Schekmanbacteria bacterium]
MSYIHHDDSNQVTPFAVTNFRDKRVVFGIKKGNRRGHMYVIGKTGTGKSTMLLNMIHADMKTGNGIALIDPHGDLAESVLDLVPESRIEDVIYFNPADTEYPIAFNPLANVKQEYHHLVSSGLISVFKKVWPEFWGPRLEHIFRYSIMTLLQYPQSTLLDVTRILTDKEFRARILRRVNNPQIQNFWSLEFDKYSAWLKSEAISPILNKVGQFLISPPLSNILGQKENTFKLRKVMDDGKILIVNLAKGKIGEDSSALLGSMMVTMIQLAAQTRAGMPENRRKHFYLYVDEFHNFITMSFADILSEARKYGLNLILAHQYIEQLDEKIRSAVFGNVGTIVSFRVGAEDAKYLAREFYPVFSEDDFVNLPNYYIYLKLMIDGVTSKAFSAVTLEPVEGGKLYREKIVEVSRQTYGEPKVEIACEVLSHRKVESRNTTKQRRLFQ